MQWEIYILILFAATLYGSVGHGGASGYLLIMTLYNFSPQIMKPTALILNIAVSAMAFFIHHKNTPLNSKLFFSLILGSVPFAFLGGAISIDNFWYKNILGLLILYSGFYMFFNSKKEGLKINSSSLLAVFILGALIGFLSGLIGIGGGIILSPILLFLRWADAKQTAVMSSIFIFVNSISGLGGIIISNNFEPHFFDIFILISALAGGIIGAYIGSFKFDNKLLKKVLAVVLIFAGIKMFWF